MLLTYFFFPFFQYATRSQKGDKDPARASDLDDGDLVSEADLSLMARTKRQAKAARDNLKKNSQACSSLDKEALDLEELLAKSREKAEAAKAARERVARLRRELEELDSGAYQNPDSDHDQDPVSAPSAPAPAPAAPDVATALAATLQSTVIMFFTLISLMLIWLSCWNVEAASLTKEVVNWARGES